MFARTRSATRIQLEALSNDKAHLRARGRGLTAASALAIAGSIYASSGALAENCTFTVTPAVTSNIVAPGISTSAVSSMIASTITAANTAFMLQSTAFIGSPPNPVPGQQGGGVWIRGVDGNVNIKSNSTGTASGTGTAFPGGAQSASVSCSQQVDVNFGGLQVGADLAKLNYNGWNLHSGVTAGDLGAKSVLTGGFPTFPGPAAIGFGGPVGGGAFVGSTHVPFIGIYGAATNGGFAVDGLLRTEFYQNTLDAPIANVLNQNIDAHGWTFATSASYQWPVPDTNWFLEPSAGLIISRTTVDQFNFLTAGLGAADSYPGTLTFNKIKSDIGRIGLRFGETVEAGGVYWQPFGAVSVWHEFGSNVVANFTSAPGFQVVGLAGGSPPNGTASVTSSTSTSTFGTYEQYSVGLSAAIAGTGWLEFVRVDYRDGPNLQGWSGSGGIRYQFTPGAPPPKPIAAKAAPIMPAAQNVNWTGFYIGGLIGATQGSANWGFNGVEVAPKVAGYLFGGEVGYNYQVDPYVVGVEVDWNRSHSAGGTNCGPMSSTGVAPAVVLSPMYEMTCNARYDWLATAAARVGYAWERALFYGKLGAAWTDEKFQATCNYGVFNFAGGAFHCTNPAGAFSNGLSASQDRVGWVVGWGSEFALTEHWSAKSEADYISFGDRNVTATDGSILKVGMHVWQEKIGVNYRF